MEQREFFVPADYRITDKSDKKFEISLIFSVIFFIPSNGL